MTNTIANTNSRFTQTLPTLHHTMVEVVGRSWRPLGLP